MSFLQFLLLCVLIVAASFGAAVFGRPASAMGGGPYMLARHSNPTANAGVFRLDTSSGGVSYCYVTKNEELICSKEAR